MRRIFQIIIIIILNFIIGCSEEEVYNPIDSGVIAYYPLDGNAFDESSFCNHGRIIGELTPISDFKGNKESAFKFENNNGYIEVIQRPNIKFNNKISLSLNLLVTGKSENWKTIVNKWNSVVDEIPRNKNCGFYLGIAPNTTTLRWNISGEYVETSRELEIGKWYQIICTFNGSEANIYIDGKLDNTALINNGLIDTFSPLVIGAQSNIANDIYPNYFNGCIDEIIII